MGAGDLWFWKNDSEPHSLSRPERHLHCLVEIDCVETSQPLVLKLFEAKKEVCALLDKTKRRRNLARTCVTLWLQGAGSPCQVLGQPNLTSTVSSNAPSDLGTSGRQRGFLFEFLRGIRRTEEIPWGRNRLSAGVRGGRTCDLASSVCLSKEGVMGPRRCVRTIQRVSLQNSQPGQGHFGGRLWPARRARPLAYFRAPALSQARTGSHPS